MRTEGSWLKATVFSAALFASVGWAQQDAMESPVSEQAPSVPSGVAAEDDPALRQRVEERWRALIKRDFLVAYEFMTPAQRQLRSADSYANKLTGAVEWRVARIERVRYDSPEVAEVIVTVAFPVESLSGDVEERTTSLREIWLKRDGQWWYSAVK